MFMAYELGLELISELAGVPERIAKRDGDLARQLTRAASSVPLNISEGNRRTGKDRIHLFRIAAGSCSEVRTALEVAIRWRYIERSSVAGALALCDRLLAMLWRLTERTSPRRSMPSVRASSRADVSSAASDSSSASAASSAADTSPAEPTAIS